MIDIAEPLKKVIREVNCLRPWRSFQFIYSLHFISDRLDKLAYLSKMFQSEFVDISRVGSLIDTEIMLMKSEFLESTCFDVNARIVDDMGYGIIPDYGPLDGQLSTLRASMQGNMYKSIYGKSNCISKEFTNIMIENLMEHFPHRGIISCFKALAPCTFPSGLEMKSYGYKEIDTLARFYGERKQLESGELLDPLIDIVVVKREYQYSKAQASFDWKGRSLRDTWVAIGRNSTTCEKYPMLLKLAHISMLQSSSIAACESGFSAQNLIKKNLCNSLNTKNLDALIRIHIEGPPLQQFAFGDSVQRWKKRTKSRHIYGESMRRISVFTHKPIINSDMVAVLITMCTCRFNRHASMHRPSSLPFSVSLNFLNSIHGLHHYPWIRASSIDNGRLTSILYLKDELLLHPSRTSLVTTNMASVKVVPICLLILAMLALAYCKRSEAATSYEKMSKLQETQ
ncbi:hypothetical protein KP509_1Z300600 [Ceratopteris richardii]|nr:hypothetical protein KP509_1Z300600 [Ceratopteris richardii]